MSQKDNYPGPSMDERMISFFQDGAKMLGLPKSAGEIFGLLYISPTPLSMQDIITRLNISKGSTSQGLKMLRTLGAVYEVEYNDNRKTHFSANVELKKIATGFIREQIRPHLKRGKKKLHLMENNLKHIHDPNLREFYKERLQRLGRWEKKANLILPLLQRFLGE